MNGMLDCYGWRIALLGVVRVMQIGLQARIGKCVGFRKDKWDLASTCKKLRPFNCPVSP